MPATRRGRFRYLIVLAILTIVLYTSFFDTSGQRVVDSIRSKTPDRVHDEPERKDEAQPPTEHADEHEYRGKLAGDGQRFPVGRKEYHPVKKLQPVPKDIKPIPRIQTTKPEESKLQKRERLERRDVVRATMKRDWGAYANYAWTHDELKPMSNGSSDPFGGWGATLVDGLDTLVIMGLMDEYEAALKAVRKIDFTYTTERAIPLFETTIRYMGGLLGAYDMARARDRTDTVLLEQAKSLGELLYAAFDTPNRLPITMFDYRQQMSDGANMRASQAAVMAEVGTLSVEFTRLAQLSGDDRYFDAIQRITDALEEALPFMSIDGLWPTDLDLSGCYREGTKCIDQGIRPVPWDRVEMYSYGGKGDSTFEYFTKQYLLLGGGKVAQQYRRLYERSIEAARKWLVFRPLVPGDLGNDKILMMGHVDVEADQPARFQTVMQHLTCFVGGMFGMGGKVFNMPGDVDIGRRLTEGCVWAYSATKTGIMPDSFSVRECVNGSDCSWDKFVSKTVDEDDLAKRATVDLNAEALSRAAFDGGKGSSIRHDSNNLAPTPFLSYNGPGYQLRPEAIESVWYMWRITGDRHWQEVGWTMWQAVEQATRTPVGHAELNHVDSSNPRTTDRCQSFWYAETLKYFYLLFDEFESVSLDHYVLNTEAHPLLRADQARGR